MTVPSLLVLVLLQTTSDAPVADAVVEATASEEAVEIDDVDEAAEGASATAPRPKADGDEDDDDTRPVRGDLPAKAGPPQPRPDLAPAQDPTFAIWSRSFGFMCGTQFATLIGCFPGLFVVFMGGAAINELGADLTGRQGTAATTVAMFGGGAVALLVGGASTLVGLGVALSGGGGSGLLIPFGLADRGTVAAGAGVAVAGLVGGAALGALLPTAAWLSTAEPVPEGPASW